MVLLPISWRGPMVPFGQKVFFHAPNGRVLENSRLLAQDLPGMHSIGESVYIEPSFVYRTFDRMREYILESNSREIPQNGDLFSMRTSFEIRYVNKILKSHGLKAIVCKRSRWYLSELVHSIGWPFFSGGPLMLALLVAAACFSQDLLLCASKL